MTDSIKNYDGFALTQDATDTSVRIYKCDVCSFTNGDIGGMKRHIRAIHKSKGEKRNHDESTENDPLDDERGEDKRPKTDEHFEPDLASTQISDEDDELDEFDEVLLAEENDCNESNATFGISDETLAMLGNETLFEYKNKERNTTGPTNQTTEGDQDVITSVLKADLAVMKA